MTPTPEQVKEELASSLDEVLFADGFEDALIGSVEHFTKDGQNTVALYDREKCIAILVDRDGMSCEDAEEFLSFNVLGAYVGPATPAYATIRRRPS